MQTKDLCDVVENNTDVNLGVDISTPLEWTTATHAYFIDGTTADSTAANSKLSPHKSLAKSPKRDEGVTPCTYQRPYYLQYINL